MHLTPCKPIENFQVPDEERKPLLANWPSQPARSEVLTLSGFPSATAAPQPNAPRIPRNRPRTVPVTRWYAHRDRFHVEDRDADAQFRPSPEQHVELYCIRGRNIFGVASFCYHIAEMLFKRDNNDFAKSLFVNFYIQARNGQTITFRVFKKA
jgi:hypothetical protein